MNRLILTSKVDADGILRMAVPVGPAEADREVQVTIESPPASSPWTSEDQRKYAEWLKQNIFGKWEGEFERMPQGEYEERDPL